MDDGKLMAIPQYWNAPMYFYRKDLFSDSKNKSDFKAKYGYDLAPFRPIGINLSISLTFLIDHQTSLEDL